MSGNEDTTFATDCPGPAIPIFLALTFPMGWTFFEGTIGMLRDTGFEPTLVSSPGKALERIARGFGVRYSAIPMAREIAPVQDLHSLWRLCVLIWRLRPLITNVGTPKAGLLGGIASWLLGVPCRIYTLHGLRLETATGAKRLLLMLTERVACACAHRVVCVSHSLRQRAIELKLVRAEEAVVLGSGSCGGVDVLRFSPEVQEPARKSNLAQAIGIPHGAPVVGFVGRFTHDKGIEELIEAYSLLRRTWPSLRLLLVGCFEDGDPVRYRTRQQIETDDHIILTGFVTDVAPYYGLMDVLVLPSHREGFPVVPLEAQACGVPVVTTIATGAIDCVIEGVTGFHVPVGDTEALAARTSRLLQDRELRIKMGNSGRERVVKFFRQEILGRAWIEEYQRLFRSKVAQQFPGFPKPPGKAVTTAQPHVSPHS